MCTVIQSTNAPDDFQQIIFVTAIPLNVCIQYVLQGSKGYMGSIEFTGMF